MVPALALSIDRLTSVVAAIGAIQARVTAVGPETVPVLDGLDRVLASGIAAAQPWPQADQAQWRGYAVRAADTATATPGTPVRLTVATADSLASGGAAPVTGGSPLPQGADAVLAAERVLSDGESLTLHGPLACGHGVVRAGSDVKNGGRIVAAGDPVTPLLASLLDAAGVETIAVHRQPQVVVLHVEGTPAGNCLVGIMAVLKRHGAVLEAARRVGPDADDLAAVLREVAGTVDLAVIVGGDGAGHDRPAAAALATVGDLVFSGLAVQPVLDVAFGCVDGMPVVALPAAAPAGMLAAEVVLQPVLRQLAGHTAVAPTVMSVQLLDPLTQKPDRQGLLPAVVYGGSPASAQLIHRSERLSALAHANALIVVPRGLKRMESGEMVTAILLTDEMFRSLERHLPPDREGLPLDFVASR